MRGIALVTVLCLVAAPARATIWSCRMDSAQETARFAVEGERLRDLRAADLLHNYGLEAQAAPADAGGDSFRIVENTADDLVALRLSSRFEPGYRDWLHVGLIMIDKHTGQLTARSVFQTGAIGYAPLDGNGHCTAEGD